MRFAWSILSFVPLLNLTSFSSQRDTVPAVSNAPASSATSGVHASDVTLAAAPQVPFAYPSDLPYEHDYDAYGRNGDEEVWKTDVCPNPPILSCSAKADETDSCCVVRPGGVLVHTQFWDLDFGTADSWGIHGLWPDKCNGRFYENCDRGRKYSGSQITRVLQDAGQTDLLTYMKTYWVSNDESPENFWAHEWATHGTCVSTLEPDCFEDYVEAQEVVPYFETVVQLFQQFNTYDALTSAGIFPSSTETYTLSELQDAVTSSLGYVPDFICNGKQLSSVQYYLSALGPLQDGKFVASQATRKSECPKSGIMWPPKTVGE